MYIYIYVIKSACHHRFCPYPFKVRWLCNTATTTTTTTSPVNPQQGCCVCCPSRQVTRAPSSASAAGLWASEPGSHAACGEFSKFFPGGKMVGENDHRLPGNQGGMSFPKNFGMCFFSKWQRSNVVFENYYSIFQGGALVLVFGGRMGGKYRGDYHVREIL